jgi:hypothetical protein
MEYKFLLIFASIFKVGISIYSKKISSWIKWWLPAEEYILGIDTVNMKNVDETDSLQPWVRLKIGEKSNCFWKRGLADCVGKGFTVKVHDSYILGFILKPPISAMKRYIIPPMI